MIMQLIYISSLFNPFNNCKAPKITYVLCHSPLSQPNTRAMYDSIYLETGFNSIEGPGLKEMEQRKVGIFARMHFCLDLKYLILIGTSSLVLSFFFFFFSPLWPCIAANIEYCQLTYCSALITYKL